MKSYKNMEYEPEQVLSIQKAILNDLTIQLYKEKDTKKRKVIKEELEAVSMATNTIINMNFKSTKEA